MRDVRGAQDRNAWVSALLGSQLAAPEVRAPRKRFFGGPLLLPATEVAPPTTLSAQRLLLQSEIVARELSLANTIAGPGTIR